MTKEISDIVKAFKTAQQEGREAALATVVKVDGSSYRMPGARMLVEDNGEITGAISGGCLEGDALRKALQAINQRHNKLVTYNTLHEDDIEFGVQLGCNGIVHILFEPIDPTNPNNPIALLEKLYLNRNDAVLITLFSLINPVGHQPGTCLYFDALISDGSITDNNLSDNLKKDAIEALTQKTSMFKQYPEQQLTAFIELIEPPVSLVIVGAGNDAIPLMDMAALLGWQITIIDGRVTHANSVRFPKALKIIVGKPAEAFAQLIPDERTVFIIMTHNYNYDLEMTQLLLQTKSRYIGTLGPRKRLERVFSELEDRGMTVTSHQKETIYGPTGLDIGAEKPEEIALSILAEIKAVMAGHHGGCLRDRESSIHPRPVQIIEEPNNFFQNIS